MATSTSALNPTASAAAAQPATPATSSARNSRLTDDEILGIVYDPAGGNSASQSPPAPHQVSGASGADGAASEPDQFRAIFEANPSLRDAWRDAQTFREIFPD